ncbi:MAG: SDR family oxidoreductase [Ginsengibacter sp.]
MKILILGATGRTGQHLVLKLLDRDHQVIALARDPAKLSIENPLLTIVKGDVLDKSLVMQMTKGTNAVISALGAGNSLNSRDLIFKTAEILIPAMIENGVKRLIFLSAFGVGKSIKKANYIQKLIFRLPLKNIYSDKEKGEDTIRNSSLEWTLVYPVVLTNTSYTGKYKVAEEVIMKGMPKISREDVAEFMVQQLTNDFYIRKTPILYH